MPLLRPSIGFGVDAEAATASFFGDRHEAATLFRQSRHDVWVEPYGMIKEAPGEDYACFLTNFGSLLQTATLGLREFASLTRDGRSIRRLFPRDGFNSKSTESE